MVLLVLLQLGLPVTLAARARRGEARRDRVRRVGARGVLLDVAAGGATGRLVPFVALG